jgi:hypothetical protein
MSFCLKKEISVRQLYIEEVGLHKDDICTNAYKFFHGWMLHNFIRNVHFISVPDRRLASRQVFRKMKSFLLY